MVSIKLHECIYLNTVGGLKLSCKTFKVIASIVSSIVIVVERSKILQLQISLLASNGSNEPSYIHTCYLVQWLPSERSIAYAAPANSDGITSPSIVYMHTYMQSSSHSLLVIRNNMSTRVLVILQTYVSLRCEPTALCIRRGEVHSMA